MYVKPRSGVGMDALAEAYRARCAEECFIVLSESRPPAIRDGIGTNDCAIGWVLDPRSRHAVIVSVIDNLGEGAAVQTVQNFNVMMGLPETEGLDHLAMVP